MQKTSLYGGLAVLMALGSGAVFAAEVPAPSASPRIDAIKQAGVLRVGVLANLPWLVENTSGNGEAWEGPAWLLAQEYATALGVRLQPVPVSHETKVPVLASNQVDLSITPLAETPERSAAAPIEEIMAKRADVAPINRVQWVLLNKKVPGLISLPQENNCQNSPEKAAPVGLAIDKGQSVLLDWLRAVGEEMQDRLSADEARIIEPM